MKVEDSFKVVQGTITGKYHLSIGKNNQDASQVRYGNGVVAVVCDGCGSSEHSEVGAQLGAHLIAEKLITLNTDVIEEDPENPIEFEMELDNIKRSIVWKIMEIANAMKGSTFNIIQDYFLFTCIAAIIREKYTTIISIGDGTVAVNGDVKRLGPFENNAPPYIAYNAIKECVKLNDDCGFKIVKIVPTSEVETILIGTDGLDDLEDAENKKIPGKDEMVGPLSQFWKNDLYFRNPHAINRRLTLINRTHIKLDKYGQGIRREMGHLRDDTTMIVIRRENDDSISAGEETKPESD